MHDDGEKQFCMQMRVVSPYRLESKSCVRQNFQIFFSSVNRIETNRQTNSVERHPVIVSNRVP